MTAIRMEAVTKSFPAGCRALDQVSVTIKQGEFFVLLGPSGSGKSTLLRVLAGLERADSGKVWFGGERVDHWSPARRRVAMVFQEPTLYPTWTVRKHVLQRRRTLGGRLSMPNWFAKRLGEGIDRERLAAEREVVRSASRECLDLLGLEPLFNRKPHQLSGGERQRVALGRAIVRDPAAFLFDEPFSSMDVGTRWALRRDWLQVQRRLGRTCVYVTHDQAEAFSLADRIGVLINGRLRQVDTPELIYECPADLDVARVTGEPPMNVWRGKLSRIDGRLILSSEWCSGEIPQILHDSEFGKVKQRLATGEAVRVWVGARPERLRLSGPTGRAKQAPEVLPEAERNSGQSQRIESKNRETSGQGRVGLVEYLGDHWIYSVVGVQGGKDFDQSASTPRPGLVGRGGVRVAVAKRPAWTEGEDVKVECDASDIHLFDDESGKRLTKAGGS